jgi:hypothetical protein
MEWMALLGNPFAMLPQTWLANGVELWPGRLQRVVRRRGWRLDGSLPGGRMGAFLELQQSLDILHVLLAPDFE